MPLDTIRPGTGLVIVLAVICVLGISFQGYAASVSERITFKSADSKVSAPIPATAYRPKGPGPFPSIVLLHACDGIRGNDSKWAEWLVTLGYVAILPDSLSPLRVSTACGGGGLTFREHALDGLGALAYLRNHPNAIPTKVAVMGWSHGGASTMNYHDMVKGAYYMIIRIGSVMYICARNRQNQIRPECADL